MREGKFREDLYYRLNVIPIHLPPLRERKSDVPSLVDYLLGRFAARGKGTATSLSPRAMAILMEHAWPGNIRELENVLEHAMVCSRGSVIEPEALPRSLLVRGLATPPGVSPSPAGPDPQNTDPEVERQLLLQALERSGWRRGRAAEALGMDRTTLWRKMRRLGIRGGS
jgi:DNA-binding NtrC family response regulator